MVGPYARFQNSKNKDDDCNMKVEVIVWDISEYLYMASWIFAYLLLWLIQNWLCFQEWFSQKCFCKQKICIDSKMITIFFCELFLTFFVQMVSALVGFFEQLWENLESVFAWLLLQQAIRAKLKLNWNEKRRLASSFQNFFLQSRIEKRIDPEKYFRYLKVLKYQIVLQTLSIIELTSWTLPPSFSDKFWSQSNIRAFLFPFVTLALEFSS